MQICFSNVRQALVAAPNFVSDNCCGESLKFACKHTHTQTHRHTKNLPRHYKGGNIFSMNTGTCTCLRASFKVVRGPVAFDVRGMWVLSAGVGTSIQARSVFISCGCARSAVIVFQELAQRRIQNQPGSLATLLPYSCVLTAGMGISTKNLNVERDVSGHVMLLGSLSVGIAIISGGRSLSAIIQTAKACIQGCVTNLIPATLQ